MIFMKLNKFVAFAAVLSIQLGTLMSKDLNTDICVYGASSSGLLAAIAVAKTTSAFWSSSLAGGWAG
jgi:ribulose 1,5-bisphosphate synthetase/thiazole synthase